MIIPGRGWPTRASLLSRRVNRKTFGTGEIANCDLLTLFCELSELLSLWHFFISIPNSHTLIRWIAYLPLIHSKAVKYPFTKSFVTVLPYTITPSGSKIKYRIAAVSGEKLIILRFVSLCLQFYIVAKLFQQRLLLVNCLPDTHGTGVTSSAVGSAFYNRNTKNAVQFVLSGDGCAMPIFVLIATTRVLSNSSPDERASLNRRSCWGNRLVTIRSLRGPTTVFTHRLLLRKVHRRRWRPSRANMDRPATRILRGHYEQDKWVSEMEIKVTYIYLTFKAWLT